MILLGERPGLGTGDGLSAYVVHDPRCGKTDGDRNMISNIHARGTPIEDAASRLAAFAAAMIEQRTSGVTLDLARLGEAGERAPRPPQVRQKPRGARRDDPRTDRPDGAVSVRRLPNADPGDDPRLWRRSRTHVSLGLVTVDQDDPTYVALDEATKHAPVDVIFAKSFYAGLRMRAAGYPARSSA